MGDIVKGRFGGGDPREASPEFQAEREKYQKKIEALRAYAQNLNPEGVLETYGPDQKAPVVMPRDLASPDYELGKDWTKRDVRRLSHRIFFDALSPHLPQGDSESERRRALNNYVQLHELGSDISPIADLELLSEFIDHTEIKKLDEEARALEEDVQKRKLELLADILGRDMVDEVDYLHTYVVQHKEAWNKELDKRHKLVENRIDDPNPRDFLDRAARIQEVRIVDELGVTNLRDEKDRTQKQTAVEQAQSFLDEMEDPDMTVGISAHHPNFFARQTGEMVRQRDRRRDVRRTRVTLDYLNEKIQTAVAEYTK